MKTTICSWGGRVASAAAAAALMTAQAHGFGWSDKGTSGAQFLKIAPGARIPAMGEAAAADCSDAYALYYNPAALGRIKRPEAALAHNSYFQGIRHDFGAVAVPMLAWTNSPLPGNSIGTLGFSVTSLGVGGIERRGVVETDAPSDTFGASDFAYTAGYGYELSQALALGGSLKAIEQTLDSAHASAFAADGGLLYGAGEFAVGAGFRNMGGGVSLGSSPDPLPFLMYAGAAYRQKGPLHLAVDIRVPRDHRVMLSLGGEYRRPVGQGMSAALRAGYNSANTDPDGLTGVVAGAGLGYGNMEFDFAWIPFGDLGNTFRYSLQLKF